MDCESRTGPLPTEPQSKVDTSLLLGQPLTVVQTFTSSDFYSLSLEIDTSSIKKVNPRSGGRYTCSPVKRRKGQTEVQRK